MIEDTVQAMAQSMLDGRSGRSTSRSRSSSRRRKSTHRSLVDRAKMIKHLVSQRVEPSVWLTLHIGIRIECYAACSTYIFHCIESTLGYSNRHLLQGVPQSDGFSAYSRMSTLYNERSAGAKVHYMSLILSTRFTDCRSKDGECSIRAYVEKLASYDKLYASANGGKGIGEDILKTKIMSLPPTALSEDCCRTFW